LRPGSRQEHLHLAQAVVGQADGAPQRARAPAARHLAVLQRAGVPGPRQPGDVRRPRGVDGDAGVVAPADEPASGGCGSASHARQTGEQRRRSDLQRSMPEIYASGWRDGAGSLS
jgi:hypothetical protein